MTRKDLDVFKTVRVIDRFLYFGFSQSTNITDLSFLENLEEIRGTDPYRGRFAIYIVITGLLEMRLKSLRFINAQSVVGRCSNLCYVQTINGSYISPHPFIIGLGMKDAATCGKKGSRK